MKRFHSVRDGRCAHVFFLRTALAVILFLVVIIGTTIGQPQLELTRAVVSWPRVELQFKAICDGSPAYGVQRQDIHLHENGREVADFTLWCPESTIRSSISVSIVLDASMSPAANAGARAFGNGFIDLMDGVFDEAAITYFNSNVSIAQQMNTLKPLLYNAVQGLPNSGSSAIWDGAYAGLVELINQGVNQGRAVILVTDGFEVSSTHSVGDVISLANSNHIRVFTIGVGDQVEEDDLRLLAGQTGGGYVSNPNAGQLAALYSDISTIVNQSGDPCIITYQSSCADGSMRQIELAIPEFCGGSVSDTLSYRAPLDSSTFRPLTLTIPPMEAMSGDTGYVPLLLPMFPGIFPRFSATLHFDERYLEFLSVKAPHGTYLENVPIDAQRIAGGVRLETLEDLGEGIYPFGGVLCLLQFRTRSVQSKTVCTITASDAAFASGCLLPDVEAGKLTIYPATTEPVLLCQLSADTLSVDEAADTYHPMPFTLRCDVRNVGSITTAPVYATLSIQPDLAYDSAGVSGESTLQLSPSTMGPLERASVSWQLWHPVSRIERRYTVMVTLQSANTDSLSFTTEVVIPPVDLNPFSFDIGFEGAAYATKWKAVVCERDSVTLDAGGGYAAYLWSTGARTRRIVVSTAGQYSCEVTDSTGLSGESNTVVVEVEPMAHTTISIWGSVPMCSNDSLILSIGPGWPGCRWNTGDTTYRTTVRAPGLYYATIVGRFGCPGFTDTIEVTTIPAPMKPVITRSADDLTSTEAHRYQWQRNGGNIHGATERTYRMTASGTYRVEVFAENGCSTFSDPFEVQVLGIAPRPSTTAFSLQSWPDPARDKLTISLSGPPHEGVRLLLSDVLGRTVLLFDGQLVSGRRQLSHEIAGYAPGPLLLMLLTSEGVNINKVLKE